MEILGDVVRKSTGITELDNEVAYRHLHMLFDPSPSLKRIEMAMNEYAKEVAIDFLMWANKTNVSMKYLWEKYQQEKSSLK
jgi:hypothetical protein